MTNTHTPACTAGWPAGRRSHCGLCCQSFSTVSNFDKHLDRGHEKMQCHTPADVGLELNDRGWWQQPGEVDIRARFAQAP